MMSQIEPSTPQNTDTPNHDPLVTPVDLTGETGQWNEDPSYVKEEPAAGVDELVEDPRVDEYIAPVHDISSQGMSVTDAEEKEPEDWKDKVSDTFQDLKEKAGDIAEDIKDKAQDVWEDITSGKLKEEAGEKIDDLKEGAKDLWNKITGKKDEPGTDA